MWLFGYGSLIWRPAFEFEERRPAHIRGYVRRFWQASPDHRGTPERPGRVVTLVEQPDATCWGMAYRLGQEQRLRILEELDYRERAGYRRIQLPIALADGAGIEGLVYIASRENRNFTGEAPLEDIARVVRTAHGPSGSNTEYVTRLADSLAEIGAPPCDAALLAALL